jgi:aryl-alcohol dehydrogenase-like predicted oxidoreductase
MNLLSLTGLQAIKTNHHMLALPQRGLIKLLRLNANELSPIMKVLHCTFPDFYLLKTTTHASNDEACDASVQPDIVGTLFCQHSYVNESRPPNNGDISLSNSANLEGTSHYQDRFSGQAAEGHFRPVQDLVLSSLGIGTYLGNADDLTDGRYAAAVVRAVEKGINVIDTAANYRFQRSERSIGRALQTLTQDRGFSRDEIVICTKGGYLPFDASPPVDVRAYIENTFVKPGIAKLNEIVAGSHCMTPKYLQSQVDQSLKNLALDCVDVYYIHNPESQLGFVSQSEFFERLGSAFEFLERCRSDGKIRKYGLATWNGFRVSPDAKEYHSLFQIASLAHGIGGEQNGFRFIQLPFNLGMPEALTLNNQVVDGQRMSLLEAASHLGITVIASASILQGRAAAGLPQSLRESLGSLATDAQAAIQFVCSAPGITTALVGMSRVEHVNENVQLLQIPPVPSEQFLQLFS